MTVSYPPRYGYNRMKWFIAVWRYTKFYLNRRKFIDVTRKVQQSNRSSFVMEWF